MKKITFTLLAFLIANFFFAQTYSTGIINFPSPLNQYSVKIDVTQTLVTLTQIMPSDRWHSLAFDNGGAMTGPADIIAYINTPNISDRTLGGYQVPAADAIQSWTTISDTVSGTTRTVVSTRALNTGEPNDYVFSASAGSINLACSRSAIANNFTLQAHGGLSNAVSTAAYQITLANESFKIDDFKIYPNPAKGLTNIQLPSGIESGIVKIYDALGRVVKNLTITSTDNAISTSDLTTGTYMVVLRTDYGNATKSLIIE
ncbi:MAG: T9SS type A sorting domain-containing protein [Flavobacterium sp.]|nr:T9SS type A sorting domain-containing protein [Flavobacterium sp.]